MHIFFKCSLQYFFSIFAPLCKYRCFLFKFSNEVCSFWWFCKRFYFFYSFLYIAFVKEYFRFQLFLCFKILLFVERLVWFFSVLFLFISDTLLSYSFNQALLVRYVRIFILYHVLMRTWLAKNGQNKDFVKFFRID